jgi:hypothetical protein
MRKPYWAVDIEASGRLAIDFRAVDAEDNVTAGDLDGKVFVCLPSPPSGLMALFAVQGTTGGTAAATAVCDVNSPAWPQRHRRNERPRTVPKSLVLEEVPASTAAIPGENSPSVQQPGRHLGRLADQWILPCRLPFTDLPVVGGWRATRREPLLSARNGITHGKRAWRPTQGC